MKFIFYSHFDYSDIWPILFGQCDKYLSDHKKVLFTNKGEAPSDWEVITYEDSLPYQMRVASCLEQLEDEIIVFSHEDMFLYDEIDLSHIQSFKNLVHSGKVDFIKLLRGGYTDEKRESGIHPYLLKCPPDMIFTIQPTICKVKNLLTMYRDTPGDSIWSFESNTAKTAKWQCFSGCMVYKEGDPKRGMHHWDSSVYPYFATAIVKGKWYTSDYPHLRTLLKDYNIDVSLRGEV